MSKQTEKKWCQEILLKKNWLNADDFILLDIRRGNYWRNRWYPLIKHQNNVCLTNGSEFVCSNHKLIHALHFLFLVCQTMINGGNEIYLLEWNLHMKNYFVEKKLFFFFFNSISFKNKSFGEKKNLWLKKKIWKNPLNFAINSNRMLQKFEIFFGKKFSLEKSFFSSKFILFSPSYDRRLSVVWSQ